MGPRETPESLLIIGIGAVAVSIAIPCIHRFGFTLRGALAAAISVVVILPVSAFAMIGLFGAFDWLVKKWRK